MDSERARVAPLDELRDFKVAEGDPDVRGWDVFDADGRRIGEVDELLIDTVARKVRYLDVDLDDALLAAGEDRHILIPIGYARLDERDNQIQVDALNAASVTTMPQYVHEPITRDYETQLRTRFDRDYTPGVAATTDFYAHDIYDPDRFYGARRATLGDTRRDLSTSQRGEHPQFGEFGRGVEGDGVTPEDDLDRVRGT